MRIEIVTVWYNEAFLAPFFLEYYKYVDKIHVIIDGNTKDESERICSKYENVQVIHWDHPDEYNVFEKTKIMNSTINKLTCDWAYALDADEFIFPETKEDPRAFLKKQEKFNVIFVKFYKVYRHITEKDLDVSLPILSQRQHGNPNLEPRRDINPRIVRPEIGIEWTTACHNFAPNNKIKVSKNYFICSHWRMANVNIAIKRLVYHRKERMCKKIRIRKKRMERIKNYDGNVVIKECEKHSRDPKIF